MEALPIEFIKVYPVLVRAFEAAFLLDIKDFITQALGHFKRQGATQLVGIELRDDVAEIARQSGHVDAVHVGDFMVSDLPYPAGNFDVGRRGAGQPAVALLGDE